MQAMLLAGIQPYQSSFSPAIPRTWCHSHAFHGFRWIRHGFVVFSDLRPEKIGQKALVFSQFFAFYLHQTSYSLMRLSTTTTTSLSHPRCRHLAMGAWLFSFFGGTLVTDFPPRSSTVSLIGLIGLIGLSAPWHLGTARTFRASTVALF